MTEPQAWPIDDIERRPNGVYFVWFKGDLDAFPVSADKLAAAGITPPPDPIDFDALPVGTVVEGDVCGDIMLAVKTIDGWYIGDRSLATPLPDWTVVHVPDAPTSYPFGDPDGPDCPKMVRETLCVAQGVVGRSPEVDARRKEHVARIQRLIDICDQHRPLGPNGKHRTAHCTPTCGCEDKRQPVQEPAAPTKRDALHTIGLTDNDIADIGAGHRFIDGLRVLIDAAREVDNGK